MGWLVDGLVARGSVDLAEACARVKCVLLHPQDARRAGGRARRRGVSSKLDHARHATVASILEDDRLSSTRLGRVADVKPVDRLVLSCDHHALLLTGVLRHLGVAVRARAGAADYLVAGQWRAHWLAEVRLDDGRWVLVDPERVLLDLPRSSFMTGSSLWLAARETAAPRHPLTQRRPGQMATFSGYQGWSALRYALLCDVTALLRAELIGYDWRLSEVAEPKPAVLRTPAARLSRSQLRFLDHAALLAADVDDCVDDLHAWVAAELRLPSPEREEASLPPVVEPGGTWGLQRSRRS